MKGQLTCGVKFIQIILNSLLQQQVTQTYQIIGRGCYISRSTSQFFSLWSHERYFRYTEILHFTLYIYIYIIQGRREGGQLGQFALGPTLLGAPYSPMSLLSCSFQPQIATPACSFLLISCIYSLFSHWCTPSFISIINYSSTSPRPPLKG